MRLCPTNHSNHLVTFPGDGVCVVVGVVAVGGTPASGAGSEGRTWDGPWAVQVQLAGVGRALPGTYIMHAETADAAGVLHLCAPPRTASAVPSRSCKAAECVAPSLEPSGHFPLIPAVCRVGQMCVGEGARTKLLRTRVRFGCWVSRRRRVSEWAFAQQLLWLFSGLVLAWCEFWLSSRRFVLEGWAPTSSWPVHASMCICVCVCTCLCVCVCAKCESVFGCLLSQCLCVLRCLDTLPQGFSPQVLAGARVDAGECECSRANKRGHGASREYRTPRLSTGSHTG